MSGSGQQQPAHTCRPVDGQARGQPEVGEEQVRGGEVLGDEGQVGVHEALVLDLGDCLLQELLEVGRRADAPKVVAARGVGGPLLIIEASGRPAGRGIVLGTSLFFLYSTSQSSSSLAMLEPSAGSHCA